MNYLAHLILSYPSDDARLGSILGDFIKGTLASHKARYRPTILEGVWVHRCIDTFTDHHILHRQSRDRLSPPYRRLSGIIIDICYDHFLIQNWQLFYQESLDEFIHHSYRILEQYEEILPDKLRASLPNMIAQDWLGECATMAGVEHTLIRISRRLRNPTLLLTAHQEIFWHYSLLEQDFLTFFPLLKRYAEDIQMQPLVDF